MFSKEHRAVAETQEILAGPLFLQAEPKQELHGWQLRRMRAQTSCNQTEFANQAGWAQPYQSQLENCTYAIFTGTITRQTIQGVFQRIYDSKSKFLNCYWFDGLGVDDVVDRIFTEHERFCVQSRVLVDAMPDRSFVKNFALLSGWSTEYVHQLMRGEIKVVSKDAALKIKRTLLAIQDDQQTQ